MLAQGVATDAGRPGRYRSSLRDAQARRTRRTGVATVGESEPRSRTGKRPGIQAQLSVRQGRAAVEFYKAAFGATELFRFGGDDANAEIVAQLAVGDGAFWVEDESPGHHNFSPQSLGGATGRMLVIVDDPRAVVERAQAPGATEI